MCLVYHRFVFVIVEDIGLVGALPSLKAAEVRPQDLSRFAEALRQAEPSAWRLFVLDALFVG
jgi:hypothetical protein